MCHLCIKVARAIDEFFISLARRMPSNKNVELGGRDGFKFFKHGVTSYLLPKFDASTAVGGSPSHDN